MLLKVGVIGPTNLQKLSRLTKKPVRFFISRAEQIGEILAEMDCELWINSDKGIGDIVAKSYKKNKGKKLVILYPKKSEPWPRKHARPYIKNADILRKEPNWFWTNYNVTALPDLCLCAGLSAGTLSELAYIKWNYQLKRGRMKRLIAIRELLRGKKLPLEIEADIKKILIYLDEAKELKQFLQKFSKR